MLEKINISVDLGRTPLPELGRKAPYFKMEKVEEINMIYLENKKVLVTGGQSMIGSSICEALSKRNAVVDDCPHSKVDLLDIIATNDYLNNFKPDYVIHAAGWNGGIEWNKKYPATIYHRTVRMALNVYSQAAYLNHSTSGVIGKKIVGILASCSYPDNELGIYKEEELWNGKPNQTVECHGLAKRVIADYGRMLKKQYAVDCVSCVLTNSFGPKDSYHPDKTKVVGALIRKFVEAKANKVEKVVCWGTGSPLREFIYSKDAGEAIVEVLEKYNDCFSPINIGSGNEVSIKELTEIISKCVGYQGEIVWDTAKPDGQKRKKLNLDKTRKFLSYEITDLEQSIRETIDWYINNKEEANNEPY